MTDLLLFSATKRVSWPYIVGALLCATWVWWKHARTHTSWKRFMFPASVWLHPSAWFDYRWTLMRVLLDTFFLGGVSLSVATTALYVARFLWKHVGILPSFSVHAALLTAVYSVVVFAAEDITRYAMHRLLHRIPALWELHKIHHSAEVLTPFTVYRTHPIEAWLMASSSALATATVAGMFIWMFPGGLAAWEIMGVYTLQFIWNVLGSNLRHSHISISYPVWLERIFSSPAQHHIHHSSNPEHHNKNFGSVFSLWDRVFGTLHIPHPQEHLVFGIEKEAPSYIGQTLLETSLLSVRSALRPSVKKANMLQ